MDNKTFIIKINTIKEQMYMVALSMLKNHADAEDAVQDAVLAAYEKIDSLKCDECFNAWMLKIVVNQAKMLIRKNHRMVLTDEIPERITMDRNCDVWDAVLSLKKEISAVIILYYAHEYSVKEIAKIMSIPAGTVKSRLAKGRELLREEIEDI